MISIITAVYDQLSLTQAYWESLLKHQPNERWEIIWIDDCSTDGTREWLKSIESDNCRAILNDHNQGFAVNNNLGAQHARGDTLCLLNNDTQLRPNWFEPMQTALIQRNRIGIVGNLQLQEKSLLVDHAGIWFDLVGLPNHAYQRQVASKIKGKGRYYPAVTAACWLIKKELFINYGGFDVSYRNGYEDVDLCLRLHNEGYRHWVAYESRILHHVSSSEGRTRHNSSNIKHFLQRWTAYSSKLGQQHWPTYYLKRIIRNPRQLNLFKTIDACLRALKLRSGDSSWARTKRAEFLSAVDQ
jgi:GT2 family glycosyltransferase